MCVHPYKKSWSFPNDSVGTLGDNWKKADYSLYDVIFHVAGIAHVDVAQAGATILQGES